MDGGLDGVGWGWMGVDGGGWVPMSHVNYKKCRPVDFKKTSCRPVDFKKMSCGHDNFKKVPFRMSVRAVSPCQF